MEQLKRKDCKNVTGLLSALTKGSSNENKANIMLFLCWWKQIYIDITEVANKEKYNVKYDLLSKDLLNLFIMV